MAIPLIAGSAILGAVGAIQQGSAQSKASAYQAQVARNNAITAEQNAKYTTLAGEQAAQREGLKSGQRQALIKVSQAANGIDINSGSAVDVQAGERATGRLDQETEMRNAALRAYGYRTQATGFTAQAGLDQAAADEAPIAAAFGATSSLFGGASKIGLLGGFGGGGISGGGGTASLTGGEDDLS